MKSMLLIISIICLSIVGSNGETTDKLTLTNSLTSKSEIWLPNGGWSLEFLGSNGAAISPMPALKDFIIVANVKPTVTQNGNTWEIRFKP